MTYNPHKIDTLKNNYYIINLVTLYKNKYIHQSNQLDVNHSNKVP